MEVIIKPSKNKNKKFDAIIDNKKKISFGAKGMSDYTLHSPDERDQRKKNYINRHKKNENWNDYMSAGFYSKHVLWNKPTIGESIKDLNKKYKNIKFKYVK